ncbi:PH domain-containing protein [Candidatus Saccharibacteria bacterium]|nr:PH domain-containing protein [Candidatus Saccharibacteria bacterium]
MAVDEKTSKLLHSRLPIGSEEEILGVYRHHWFVYVIIWFLGFVAVLAVMVAAVLMTSSYEPTTGADYRPVMLMGAMLLSVVIALGTAIPAWLKSQEQLVVTDEALLQVLQPSLFGSKVSQLSLQHVTDVSVRKDFFGTLFGYGTITVETPGEQVNYVFTAVPSPDKATKVIIEAHENLVAALESGRMPTTLLRSDDDKHSVKVDAAEYQKFLDFQQYQARAAQQTDATDNNPNQ